MSGQGQPLLKGLLGVIVALLAWTVADSLAEERKPIEQRKQTAQRLLSRETADATDLRARWLEAQSRREALVRRLSADEDVQLARARLYYELRERCARVGLSCSIRLGENRQVPSPSAGTPAPADAVRGGLERLGVQRLQARLSGQVGERGIAELLQTFADDSDLQWRVNRLQLRGKGFELDIERHLMSAGSRVHAD